MLRFHKLNILIISLCFIGTILVTTGCVDPPAPPTPTQEVQQESVKETENGLEVRVHQYSNETAIDFQFSTDWIIEIPRQGIIAVGPQETVYGNKVGPFVSILRVPIGQVHGNLEGELNHFLDFGPKRDGYKAIDGVTDFEIDGRPAKQVRLTFEGNAEKEIDAQEAWVVGAEANNGVVYIVSASAPPENWAENEILFKLLVNSLKFNE